ncbi:MAG: universal stress protein [Pseudomonadota bacterium]
MFAKIMLPVDLAHADGLGKSIEMATEIAKSHGASLTLVGVTGTGPGEVAATPEGYAQKLDGFANDLAGKSGISVAAKSIQDNDVAADLGGVLVDTAKDLDADLIVMASHVPGMLDHVFSSNAGYVASHATCSVAVVR